MDNFIAWQHKLRTQNSHNNWSFFLPQLCQHGPVYSAINRGSQTSTELYSGSENKTKLQEADEWLPPTTGHVPIFIGLTCSLMSCKAGSTEAWGCLYYSGCCCKDTSQESNLPGEEQQDYHARKQNYTSEPQNCLAPISFLQKVNQLAQ